MSRFLMVAGCLLVPRVVAPRTRTWGTGGTRRSNASNAGSREMSELGGVPKVWQRALLRHRPPVTSEDRERVERRAHALVNPQRRRGEHELVAVQTPRRRDRPLEIQVVEDVHAERRERQQVDR